MIFAVIVFSISPPPSPLPLHAASVIEQANQAWSQRAEPGLTQKAVELWDKAVKEDPSNTTLYIRMTRAAGRVYRRSSKKSEQRRWAERARDYGKLAVEKNPLDSAAYTEYAAALGQWADSHRGIGALKAVKQAVAHLHKALELDPKNAYAHMLLSEFYGESPSTFSVGNKELAMQEARKAVELNPHTTITHMALAKRLISAKQKEEAIRVLQKLLTVAPPADYVPEALAEKETARRRLQELGVTPVAEPAACAPSPLTLPSESGVCAP